MKQKPRLAEKKNWRQKDGVRSVRKEASLFPEESQMILDAAAASKMLPAEFIRMASIIHAHKTLRQQQKLSIRKENQ
jgi:uncharacterized protein (DUF1778 family)